MHSYPTYHPSFYRLAVASTGNRRTAILEIPNLQLRRRVIAETRRTRNFAQPPTERKERHFLPSLKAGSFRAGYPMKKLLLTIAIAAPMALLSGVSSAKGCLKGAAVGGVVGHVAGHHAVVGAAAGCVIGHHQAKMRDKAARQAGAPSADRPSSPPPADAAPII